MIYRSEERIKETGEIFTPLALVDEVLDLLPEGIFTDVEKTFLDPACGDGNFLVRVISYKIHNGSSIHQALNTTYGVDLMEDNIAHCKERILQLADDYDTTIHGMKATRKKYGKIVDYNIVCADSLNGWDFENWKPKVTQEDITDQLLTF